jgi:hypothetical protein
MATDALYEEDFVRWTERQADELRRLARDGSNLPLDWENLAEEIASVGRSERNQVRSLIRQIVAHLVKLACSPSATAGVGWESEVEYFRSLLEGTLEDSPSLRPYLVQILPDETERGRRAAVRSLARHGEHEAAAAARALALELAPEQLLDPDWSLAGSGGRAPGAP